MVVRDGGNVEAPGSTPGCGSADVGEWTNPPVSKTGKCHKHFLRSNRSVGVGRSVRGGAVERTRSEGGKVERPRRFKSYRTRSP